MTSRPPRRLDEWLQWQERLHPRAIELGLDRIRRVATALGLPDARPRTLTVAGTNGKGSSATLAAGIYRAAGYRTGLYTSPHLLHYRERIVVDGQPADDAALCAAFEAIDAARGDVPLTYFEFGTLAALWLFREARVDVQVLEVGLGGRLDAVNLVDADAALLTNVGLDHQDWLGDDREQIGREKAGVFRPGRPAIVVEPAPPASVLNQARALGAPLCVLGRDFDFSIAADARWSWRAGARRQDVLPAPGLPGAVQYQNAAGVLAAIDALQPQLPVGRAAIDAALSGLRLRGRCEWHRGMLFDVAHNLESAQVLADYLAVERKPTVLVLGMLSDKPVAAVAAALAPQVDIFITVGLPPPRGLGAEDLRRTLTAAGLAAHSCDNIGLALREARARAGADGRVVVSGSFLTVAAALSEIDVHG